MANEIGWGAAFSEENGYGMAAVTGAEIGYGTVVVNSYSGDTNISSRDEDNRPAGKPAILDELPIIYMDGINMYLYYTVNPSVTPVAMTYQLFVGDRFYADASLTTGGIHWIGEEPSPGDYYLELTIVIDSENASTFTSNVLSI